MHRLSSNSFLDIGKIVSEHITDNILCLHADSGCDTTSFLTGVGICQSVMKHPPLAHELAVFMSTDADLEALKNSGLNILGARYNPKELLSSST